MFADAKLLPPDPILGLTKSFQDDPRPGKIDLGVGVYRTRDNRTPIMQAVTKAEAINFAAQTTKAYTPPTGAPGFGPAILDLIFGADSEITASGRASAMQTPGGCGALRVAGELLHRQGATAITIGSPTWANHMPLLSAAGNTINMVPYYNKSQSVIEFDAFADALRKLGPKDVALLHGGCHNPTGADLTHAQIDQIAEIAAERGFLPFVDIAYHGFAKDLETDAYMIRTFANKLPEVIITYSCSKNFGLYRERTGALIIVGETADRTNATLSHAISLARANYSMPPAHGGAIVATILGSAELSALWRKELTEMATAVRGSRKLLAETGRTMGLGKALAFIENQTGMFSLLPLSDQQVLAMSKDHGVYIVGGGRINMCGVNEDNVEALVKAFQSVTHS